MARMSGAIHAYAGWKNGAALCWHSLNILISYGTSLNHSLIYSLLLTSSGWDLSHSPSQPTLPGSAAAGSSAGWTHCLGDDNFSHFSPTFFPRAKKVQDQRENVNYLHSFELLFSQSSFAQLKASPTSIELNPVFSVAVFKQTPTHILPIKATLHVSVNILLAHQFYERGRSVHEY